MIRDAEIHLRKFISPCTSRGSPVVRCNDDGIRKTARGLSSPRVIGGSIVRNAAAVLREVVRAAVKGQREKKRARAPEREVARFFPTAWKNQPPTSLVSWGQATVAAAWKRRAAGCGGDEKRGRGGLPRVVSVVAGGGSLKNTPQPHRAAPPQKPPSSTAEPKRDRAS